MWTKNAHPGLLCLVFVTLFATSCRLDAQVTTTIAAAETATLTKAVEVPENSAVASPLLQREGEDLEAFLVRIAVAELIYSPSETSVIIHSVVEDETDLGFGVSTHQDNAKACWVHHSDATLPCANDVFEQVFHPLADTPAMLKIFFAVAYQRGEEALVIYDRHDSRNSVDSVDGFRVVVVLENGWWREQSLQAVY